MKLNEEDMQIVKEGTRALINALGYSGFLKYLSRLQIYSGGYFREEERIYMGVELEEDKNN